jgi:hypothetical protein
MMNDSKLAKLQAALGKSTVEELTALSPADLKARITNAHKAIKTAKEELDKSPEYNEAKEDVRALSQGFRDLKKRQHQVSDYCLHLLDEKGE